MKTDRKGFFVRACGLLGLPFFACAGKRVPDVPNCPPAPLPSYNVPPPNEQDRQRPPTPAPPKERLPFKLITEGVIVEIYGLWVSVEIQTDMNKEIHLSTEPFRTGVRMANGDVAVAVPPLRDDFQYDTCTFPDGKKMACWGFTPSRDMTGECPAKFKPLLHAAVEQTNLHLGWGRYHDPDNIMLSNVNAQMSGDLTFTDSNPDA